MTETLHRLVRLPQGVMGLALLAILVLLCLLGPALAPYQPEAMDFMGRFAAPGVRHWLGADQLGRDVLSRLQVGAQTTVPLALAAPLSGTTVGACIGTLSAYLGGRWDEAIMRTIDAAMAVPHLLLALILVSTLGKGSLNATLAIAISVAALYIETLKGARRDEEEKRRRGEETKRRGEEMPLRIVTCGPSVHRTALQREESAVRSNV